MFRDQEVIDLINSLIKLKKNDREFIIETLKQITSKIDDLEDLSMTTNSWIENIQSKVDVIENKMYEEAQVKKIVKEAMAEFKEQMEKPEKKAIKKK